MALYSKLNETITPEYNSLQTFLKVNHNLIHFVRQPFLRKLSRLLFMIFFFRQYLIAFLPVICMFFTPQGRQL